MATTHSGRVFVMQFERYGRSGAQPVFQVRTSTGGIMTPAHNLVIYEAPHRADISGIDHPDAIAIEHAWEDIQSLLGEIDRLRAESAGVREACARICDERAKSAAEGIDDLDDVGPEVYARLRTRSDEAEDCAAAIRAMGAP